MSEQEATVMVKLWASNRETPCVEASPAAVQLSATLVDMLALEGPDIHTSVMRHATLLKAIEYCEYHARHGDADTGEWDAAYCPVDQVALFDLILAANYLQIKGLLDLTCQTVANMIKGKSPEQIRLAFNIKNDFTPEEEERVHRENAWCEVVSDAK